jgi:hypothetical protein
VSLPRLRRSAAMSAMECPWCSGKIEPASSLAMRAHLDACPDYYQKPISSLDDMLELLGSRFRLGR